MTLSLTIPWWLALIVWSAAGYFVAQKLTYALESRTLIGKPTIGDKFWRLPRWKQAPILLGGIALSGPVVWAVIAWAFARAPIAKALAAVRNRVRRDRS